MEVRTLVRRMYFILALMPIVISFLTVAAAAQSGRAFYIDYASGSNSNPGTQASPWKTHPYMQSGASCTGTGSAPSYSHQAGDQFIFKGGVTWPAACFQMTLQAGGSSGASDYYGVCLSTDSASPCSGGTSWPSSGWARPIFDLAQTIPTSGGGGNNNVICAGVNYITIDNFEIKNQGISTSTVIGATAAINFHGAGWSNTVSNSYIHDFMTNSQLTSSWAPDYGAGGIYNAGLMLATIIDDSNGFGYNASGTKILGGTIGGACENCGEVSGSKFVKTMAACFTVPSCHDSEFTGITQTILDATNPNGYAPLGSVRPHTQVIENDFNGQSTIHNVYNNFIHDNTNVGVTIYECDGTNIYNNVMFNNGGNPDILLSACSSLGSSARGERLQQHHRLLKWRGVFWHRQQRNAARDCEFKEQFVDHQWNRSKLFINCCHTRLGQQLHHAVI